MRGRLLVVFSPKKGFLEVVITHLVGHSNSHFDVNYTLKQTNKQATMFVN